MVVLQSTGGADGGDGQGACKSRAQGEAPQAVAAAGCGLMVCSVAAAESTHLHCSTLRSGSSREGSHCTVCATYRAFTGYLTFAKCITCSGVDRQLCPNLHGNFTSQVCTPVGRQPRLRRPRLPAAAQLDARTGADPRHLVSVCSLRVSACKDHLIVAALKACDEVCWPCRHSGWDDDPNPQPGAWRRV
jgi:hypothetical protein